MNVRNNLRHGQGTQFTPSRQILHVKPAYPVFSPGQKVSIRGKYPYRCEWATFVEPAARAGWGCVRIVEKPSYGKGVWLDREGIDQEIDRLSGWGWRVDLAQKNATEITELRRRRDLLDEQIEAKARVVEIRLHDLEIILPKPESRHLAARRRGWDKPRAKVRRGPTKIAQRLLDRYRGDGHGPGRDEGDRYIMRAWRKLGLAMSEGRLKPGTEFHIGNVESIQDGSRNGLQCELILPAPASKRNKKSSEQWFAVSGINDRSGQRMPFRGNRQDPAALAQEALGLLIRFFAATQSASRVVSVEADSHGAIRAIVFLADADSKKKLRLFRKMEKSTPARAYHRYRMRPYAEVSKPETTLEEDPLSSRNLDQASHTLQVLQARLTSPYVIGRQRFFDSRKRYWERTSRMYEVTRDHQSIVKLLLPNHQQSLAQFLERLSRRTELVIEGRDDQEISSLTDFLKDARLLLNRLAKLYTQEENRNNKRYQDALERFSRYKRHCEDQERTYRDTPAKERTALLLEWLRDNLEAQLPWNVRYSLNRPWRSRPDENLFVRQIREVWRLLGKPADRDPREDLSFDPEQSKKLQEPTKPPLIPTSEIERVLEWMDVFVTSFDAGEDLRDIEKTAPTRSPAKPPKAAAPILTQENGRQPRYIPLSEWLRKNPTAKEDVVVVGSSI